MPRRTEGEGVRTEGGRRSLHAPYEWVGEWLDLLSDQLVRARDRLRSTVCPLNAGCEANRQRPAEPHVWLPAEPRVPHQQTDRAHRHAQMHAALRLAKGAADGLRFGSDRDRSSQQFHLDAEPSPAVEVMPHLYAVRETGRDGVVSAQPGLSFFY